MEPGKVFFETKKETLRHEITEGRPHWCHLVMFHDDVVWTRDTPIFQHIVPALQALQALGHIKAGMIKNGQAVALQKAAKSCV